MKDASKRLVALEEHRRSIGRAEAPSTVAAALTAVRHFWYCLDRRDGGKGSSMAGTRHEAGDARPGSREAGGQAARDALIGPVIRSARESLRLQHKSYKTEQAYLSWIDRFLRHAAPAAPADLGAEHVRRFLSWTIHYTPNDSPVERTTWSRIKSSR